MDSKIRKYFDINYPNYNIEIGDSVFRGDVIRVYLEKDGVTKSVLFNVEEEKEYSNLFDGLYQIVRYYGNAFTLHSYEVNDIIRSFVAITNVDSGTVLPIGYDLNNFEFIMLPINNEGLIDDNGMIETIKTEDCVTGFSPLLYKEIVSIGNIYSILMYLNADIVLDVIDKLFDYNKDMLEVLKDKTDERIRNKNRNKQRT